MTLKPRYRDKTMQGLYDTMLKLAADPTSELYHAGEQRTGAGHRAAFWDGFNGMDYAGPRRSAHVIHGTLSAACFMAGREHARRLKKKEAQAQAKLMVARSIARGTLDVNTKERKLK